MRVILDLDEMVLNKLSSMAEIEKRSRKNFMELVLESASDKKSLVNKFDLIVDNIWEAKTKKELDIIINGYHNDNKILPHQHRLLDEHIKRATIENKIK